MTVRRTNAILLVTMGLVAVFLSGCASRGKAGKDQPQYQTVGDDPRRDTEAARAENLRALELLDKGEIDKAEATLKRALTADIMYGPAHNNLGKVYFRQNKLYLAAWEFEYAAKLMPHQPEPKNNMGLVFEAAGKWDEAVDHYSKALALEPDNPELIGNTARARLRRGDTGPEVRELLSKLVMHDTRSDWVDWARRRLSRMPEAPVAPTEALPTAPSSQPQQDAG